MGWGSGDWQGIWAQGAPRVRGLRIDVLSTQSTRDPEVVNGIRESIADGHPGRAERRYKVCGSLSTCRSAPSRGRPCVIMVYRTDHDKLIWPSR